VNRQLRLFAHRGCAHSQIAIADESHILAAIRRGHQRQAHSTAPPDSTAAFTTTKVARRRSILNASFCQDSKAFPKSRIFLKPPEHFVRLTGDTSFQKQCG